jgi:hypothetical protein
MNFKNFGPVSGLLLILVAGQVYGACDPIAPNPNPAGNTVTNTSTNGCSEVNPFENAGTLNNTGQLEADLRNEGTVNNSGTLKASSLDNAGTINNSGTITNSNQVIEIRNTGIIRNTGSFANVGGPIRNHGTFFNTGTTGAVSDSFFNSGLLVNSGRVISSGASPFQNSGLVISNGEISSSGGIGSVGGRYFQSAGTTVVNGTMAQSQVMVDGGTLQGTGTIISSSGAGIPPADGVQVNGGTINAGAFGAAIGTLTVDGDVTFNSGGLLTEIAAAGLNDLLKVTDTASFLAGTFTFSFLNDYLPNVGDSWTFLQAGGGISGWQSLSLAYAGIPSNYLFSVSERDNSLVLSVAAVPEPEVYASMALGLALLGFMSRKKRGAAIT